MAKFKVPPRYKKGFQILLSLDKSKVGKLIEHLSTAQYGAYPEVLKGTIPATLLKSEDAGEVVDSIWSIYQLKPSRKSKLKPEELVEGIIEALKEEKIPLKDKNWKRFKDQFKQLLNIDNIRLTTKSIDLSYEYEKVCFDSRIVTDIRLAFDDEIEKDTKNGVIIHNLRIEFHQDKGHDKFMVALDSEDLKQLSDQIVRAQKKESLIRKKFEKTIKFV
jgi:hypothetical protein